MTDKNQMPGMRLDQIRDVLQAEFIGNEWDLSRTVTFVTMDSRKAEKGCLFFAVKGEHNDGHDYVADVFGKGALAVICEHNCPGAGGNQLIVPDSIRALQKLAAYYRSCLDTKVVTVTGSVGKTSTKEMIASVLGESFRVLKTIGNYNNEIGLPLTVFRIRPEDEIAVLEAGIDEPGEMDVIANAAKPDVCVITNIGICHLENLGSRQGIFDEKTKCFQYMQPGGIAVLNRDDDLLSCVEHVGDAAPVFFSLKETDVAGAVYITDAEDLGYDGSNALLHTPGGTIEIHVAIPGLHQLGNAAAAAAVGLHFGMPLAQIAKGIQKARTIQGRTNLIHTHGITLVDDCYNANPASMKAALALLTKAKGRKIAVLGDMGELGPEERSLHREVGLFAAGCGLDAVFLSGELAKEIQVGLEMHSDTKVFYYTDREKLTAALRSYIEEGDTVLIKASHFMHYEELVDKLHDRSDG